MRIAHRLATVAAVGAVAVGTVAVAPAAQADDLGNTSLATVLGVDGVVGNGFDSNWDDFDIVREAADAVIAAKGSSHPGGPARRRGHGADRVHPHRPRVPSARARPDGHVARARPTPSPSLASLGIDTVEAVLLYHVVPGTIDSGAALAADGATVATVQGGGITVDVRSTARCRSACSTRTRTTSTPR